MDNNLVDRVEFEIEQLDRLLTIYADLLANAQQSPPDLIAKTAIASVLHSFYNGIENIFLSMAKVIDRQVPSGDAWHHELLIQMSRPTERRSAVISADVAQQLIAYLGFRHFYRHSYSFFLDWDKMSSLVILLPDVWARVKAELTVFLNNLPTNSNTPGSP